MTRLLLLIALAFASCGPLHERGKAKDPSQSVQDRYAAAVSRLTTSFLEDGQVVSRRADGHPEHVGDSLLWTGVAIGALPCADAAPLVARLVRRLEENGGQLVRFEPLPESYAGDEISFDGETGLYYGLARFVTRCGVPDGLAAAWAKRQAAIAAQGERLHPNVPATMPAEFTFTRDALGYALGLRGAPALERQLVLEQQIALWIEAVKLAQEPCFRANLGWLHVQAFEGLGYGVSEAGRRSLCAATDGMQIPTWEFFCGRPGLPEFVEAFEFDRYEFRHQRCGYEVEDGGGVASPALDLIVALRVAYNL